MFDLKSYNTDGASWQAQAVACCLKGRVSELESLDWNDKRHRSNITIEIGRYENCREEGYVVRFESFVRDLNVCYCFFEHRNSDNLCCIKFRSNSINTPSIEEIWAGRGDKYDVSHREDYGEVLKMAMWIAEDASEEILMALKNS